jgi:HAD superfamily hydrolase (TIGR01509 family)|tara:strand:+ start:2815 stop:3495 length:681 start_codon:yes stop_codon:yes gene_type:complete
MTRPLDLVIFDCDGVLIDSEPIASRTLARSLSAAGLSMTAEEALRTFTGKSEADMRYYFKAAGICGIDSLFSNWHADVYAAFAAELRAMAGIEPLLRALDVPKCVASNSTLVRLKKSLGLLDLWDIFAPHIFSAEMVARPKPAPDLVLHCLAAFDARPERSIMIDDSHHGIQAASAAGVKAIGFVDPNDPRPDRREVLLAAGAAGVAVGAEDLAAMIIADLAPSTL